MRGQRAAYAPVLETGRLMLHPLDAGDADALHRVSNEPCVRRYLWDDEPVEKATIRSLIAQSNRTFYEESIGLFGVRMRRSEDLLGFCSFLRLEGIGEPELGYELTLKAWSKGLATEAARACLRYAFEEVGLKRVVAGTDAPNTASLRVIEKLGMKPIGNINPSAPNETYYALGKIDFFALGGARRRGAREVPSPHPQIRTPGIEGISQ